MGQQLTCIFVDHGLLRQGEALQVIETFEREQGMKLVAVNAIEQMMEALQGVTDPEQKRKLIGVKFVRLFEREAARLEKLEHAALITKAVVELGREQPFPQEELTKLVQWRTDRGLMRSGQANDLCAACGVCNLLGASSLPPK